MPQHNNFLINGQEIFTPTSGRWLPQRAVDIQGDNRPIYSGVRAFELRWRLVSWDEWANLQVLFNGIASTGTYTVRIPTFPTITGSAYGYTTYSGCTMAEPAVGPYFEQYPTQVVLIIGNITT